MKKKIFALMLAFIMLLNVAVSADSLAFLDKKPLNYTENISFSLKFNSPLLIFEALKEAENHFDFGGFETVDYTRFFEELAKGTNTVDVAVSTTADNKKSRAEISMNSDNPIYINKNLQANVRTLCKMWFEYDFTNESAPVMDMIIQSFLSDKYMYFDLIEIQKSSGMTTEEIVENFNKSIDGERMEALTKAVKESIKNNSKIEVKGKTYTVKLDKNGANQFVKDLVKIIMELSAEFYADKTETELVDPAQNLEEVLIFLDGINIFGDKGITLVYTVDAKGNVENFSMDVNLKFVISDIINSLGVTETEPLTAKNSVIDISLCQESVVKVSDKVNIELPKLTDENSLNIYELVKSEETDSSYDEWYEEYRKYNCIYLYDDLYIKDNTSMPYVKIRDVIDELNHDYNFENKLEYDNGIIKIFADENGIEKFKVASFKVGESVINIDGAEYNLDNPVIMSDGSTYVDKSLLNKLFGLTISDAEVSLIYNSIGISFERDFSEDAIW